MNHRVIASGKVVEVADDGRATPLHCSEVESVYTWEDGTAEILFCGAHVFDHDGAWLCTQGHQVWVDEPEFDEPPTCSICDGLGHGYPGAGPCPLEERGWEDAEQDRRIEAHRGVLQ